MKNLTQAELKIAISYDRATGILRRVDARPHSKKGAVCGSKNSCGYLNVGVGGVIYPAHRLAFLYETGRWPKDQIDHINGQKDDNRWINLREATQSQNMANRQKQKNNVSGFIGVCWCNRSCSWISYVRINGKHKRIGLFDDKIKAAIARDDLAFSIHGDRAILNFPKQNGKGL